MPFLNSVSGTLGVLGTRKNSSRPPLSVQYLIAAGGGGGGHGGSSPQFAGGGAGGLLQGSTSLATSSYAITIGAGGPSGSTSNRFDGPWAIGGNGNNTTGIGLTTIAGGGAGGGAGSSGSSGGSGGGQGGTGGGGTAPNNAPGTAGQGNQGGARSAGNDDAAGGGGGAGTAGSNGVSGVAGNGGNGILSSISGTSLGYAGGGGRLDNGYRSGFPASPNATANSGSGGGGANGNGGSGIIILKYPDAYTVTTSGLTATTASPSGGFKVTSITAGTGTVTFS
jgi:hypothetical protein